MDEKIEPEKLFADHDWQESFEVAMRAGPRAVMNYVGDVSSFEIEDIAEVVAHSDGEHDERDWIAALHLKGGRFAFMRAGCDYTGWGCRDWGDVEIASTLDDLVRYAMTPEERRRLAFKDMIQDKPEKIDD